MSVVVVVGRLMLHNLPVFLFFDSAFYRLFLLSVTDLLAVATRPFVPYFLGSFQRSTNGTHQGWTERRSHSGVRSSSIFVVKNLFEHSEFMQNSATITNDVSRCLSIRTFASSRNIPVAVTTKMTMMKSTASRCVSAAAAGASSGRISSISISSRKAMQATAGRRRQLSSRSIQGPLTAGSGISKNARSFFSASSSSSSSFGFNDYQTGSGSDRLAGNPVTRGQLVPMVVEQTVRIFVSSRR